MKLKFKLFKRTKRRLKYKLISTGGRKATNMESKHSYLILYNKILPRNYQQRYEIEI